MFSMETQQLRVVAPNDLNRPSPWVPGGGMAQRKRVPFVVETFPDELERNISNPAGLFQYFCC